MGLWIADDFTDGSQRLMWRVPESDDETDRWVLITLWRGDEAGDTLVVHADAWNREERKEAPWLWVHNGDPRTTGNARLLAANQIGSVGSNELSIISDSNLGGYGKAFLPLMAGAVLFMKQHGYKRYRYVGRIKSFELIAGPNNP